MHLSAVVNLGEGGLGLGSVHNEWRGISRRSMSLRTPEPPIDKWRVTSDVRIKAGCLHYLQLGRFTHLRILLPLQHTSYTPHSFTSCPLLALRLGQVLVSFTAFVIKPLILTRYRAALLRDAQGTPGSAQPGRCQGRCYRLQNRGARSRPGKGTPSGFCLGRRALQGTL